MKCEKWKESSQFFEELISKPVNWDGVNLGKWIPTSKENIPIIKLCSRADIFISPQRQYLIKQTLRPSNFVNAHLAGYHSDEDSITVIRGFGIDSADKVLDFKQEDFVRMAAKAHESLNPEELKKAVTSFSSTFEEQMSIMAVLIDSAFAE